MPTRTRRFPVARRRTTSRLSAQHVLAALTSAACLMIACTAAPTPSDAGPPLSCNTSLDAYCAANPCERDLAARQHACSSGETIARCGAFDVVTFGFIDTYVSSYYDVSTGKLVAVVGGMAPAISTALTCAAGPPTFAPPSDSECTAPTLSCERVDAGMDAATDTDAPDH